MLSENVSEYLTQLEYAKKDRDLKWKKLIEDSEKPYSDSERKKILIIGDSLSEDLFVSSAISTKLQEKIDIRRLTFDDRCALFIATGIEQTNHDDGKCSDAVNVYLKSDLFHSADLIIIAANWVENYKYFEQLLNHRLLENKDTLIYLTQAFSDIRSIIYSIDSIENNSESLGKLIFESKRSVLIKSNEAVKSIARKSGIQTIEGFDAFCDSLNERCVLFDEQKRPYIWDQNHLTYSGALFFEKWFSKSLIAAIEKIDNDER